MTKSKIFLTFCLTFILGVFVGRFISQTLMALSAMFFIIVLTIGWQSRLAMTIGLAGLIAVFGAWRFEVTYRQNDLSQFYNQKVTAAGVIATEPDRRLDKTYLTIGDVQINNQNLTSKILLSVPLYPEYEYRQHINFEVKIQEPKEFEDFSYKNYLSRFGIDAVGYSPTINTVEDPNWGTGVALLKIKQKFVNVLNQSLPEPHSSFMAGLLLGAKRSIPEDIQDHFRTTGTAHIVVISGYNISVIAMGIGWALQQAGLRKRFSFLLAVAAIIGFVFMTGASSAVVRAGIMGILLLIALNVGRVYEVSNILGFSAVTMIAINPQILHFDVAFQLSFTAVLGLVYFTPLIEPYFLWVPKYFRQFLLATLSAQVFTLPILLYYFGQISLIAVVANLLIVPLIPFAMLSGLLTGIAGLIWFQLAWPFMLASWILLEYMLKTVKFLSSLPFGAINFSINVYGVAFYYIILVLILNKYYGANHQTVN